MRFPVQVLSTFGYVLLASAASGDVLTTVVDQANSTAGKSIGAFAYDPINDRMFVTSYGSSPFDAPGAIRLISNVSGTQVATNVISEGQLQLFYRDNDTTRSVTFPILSGFLFNPKSIGSFAPYSRVWAADASLTRLPGGSNTTDPAATKRYYRFDPSVTPDVYPTNALTSLATLSDLQAHVSTTSTSSNWGRQFAWSNDGQWIYHNDSSAAFGGTWKLNPVTGESVRISAVVANTEVAVLDPGGGVDRIVFRGTGANVGGLDYIDHNASTQTTSAATPLLEAGVLADFLDQGNVAPITFSATSDPAGNLYFNSTSGTGTVMRLDPQGRLISLVSKAERAEFLGASPNSNTLRMQLRQINHATAGKINQLLYAENADKSVSGINIFDVGDFDRDGSETMADRAMFLASLSPRGTAMPSGTVTANGRYDLNGNGSIDWKDVKILQTFLGFENGDVNLDGSLTLEDLDVMAANYYTFGGAADKTWADGDIASLDPLATVYAADAADANIVNSVDVNLFAQTWLNVLGLPQLTIEDVDGRGYTGQFRSDVISALVPEPATLSILASAAFALTRRRRIA
jgi:hypothetical protein